MSSWIVYSLAVSFFWGIANILDTLILSRYKLSPWIYFTLDGLLGVLPVILFIFISPFSITEKAIVFSVSSGVFIAIFNILYFSSLNLTDVSVVAIMIQITPIFSLLWGISLLGEKYNLINYSGMFLIIIGTVFATTSEIRTEKSKRSPKTLIAFGLMVIATFSLSMAYLLQKMALNQSSNVLIVFGWQRVSLFIISLLLVLKYKREIIELPYQPIVLTLVVEIISITGFLFLTLAYSLGSLSEVTFFSSLQPAWVLIILWIFQMLKIHVVTRVRTISSTRVVIACGIVILGLFFMSRF